VLTAPDGDRSTADVYGTYGVWPKLNWFDFLSICCEFVVRQIEQMEFEPYTADDDCRQSAWSCVYSAMVDWAGEPSSRECHRREMIYLLPRGAIQCKARSCYHMSSVCPSVTLVDHDHIGWKSWKLIVQTISPASSLFVAKRSSTYSQGNMDNFGEKMFVQHLRP